MQVLQVPGGVGRNMAEALSRLVPPARPAPAFVSLVGDDAAGAFLTGTLRKLRCEGSLGSEAAKSGAREQHV